MVSIVFNFTKQQDLGQEESRSVPSVSIKKIREERNFWKINEKKQERIH